jgi:hypothetical protein
MRVTTLLALLFLLAAASQATAATKVIRFGKLIDGTGRVITNAVVVVEDDRVQRVASGNVPIPPGAEVIDLSRLTQYPIQEHDVSVRLDDGRVDELAVR